MLGGYCRVVDPGGRVYRIAGVAEHTQTTAEAFTRTESLEVCIFYFVEVQTLIALRLSYPRKFSQRLEIKQTSKCYCDKFLYVKLHRFFN